MSFRLYFQFIAFLFAISQKVSEEARLEVIHDE